MKIMLMLGFGLALAASGAFAQTSDVAVWRPYGAVIPDGSSLLPQFIQQDLSRGAFDRDRGARGGRWNREDDDDREQSRGGGRASGPVGGLPEGHPGMMRPPMGGGMMGSAMMAAGGARFHMRKGDAAIDVRCPADVRLNECVDEIGRVLDRLGSMGAGSGGSAPGPR